MQTSVSRRKNRKINIGDLNKKIKLQRRVLYSSFQSGGRGQGASFETFAEPWASIETTKGITKFDGVELKKAYTHKITIRYRSNLDQTSWIEFGGNRYDIVDIEDLDERHEFLLLMCKLTGNADSSHTSTEA